MLTAGVGTIVEWVEARRGWSAYAGRPETSPASGLTASFVRPAPAFSPSVCQRLPRLLRTS